MKDFSPRSLRRVAQLLLLVRAPASFAPTLLMPLLFLIAFSGALSRIAKLPDFGSINYTSFQYVYALMQAAAFAGAVGGTAMTGDIVNGFMDRLMLSARRRAAIVAGYVVAMLAGGDRDDRAHGLRVPARDEGGGKSSSAPRVYALAVLLNLTASLWSGGIAMHIPSLNAAPLEILPIFLALFLTPVFLPLHLLHGWLHTVAVGNPFTRPLEAGRSLIEGNPSGVAVASPCWRHGGRPAALFALWGVRRFQAG